MKKQRFFLVIMILLIFGANHLPAIPIHGNNLGMSAVNARLKLISTAESYLGTSYRFGGVDYRGMDCSGLVYRSFMDALDVLVPRTSQLLYIWALKIPSSDIKPGDLVFFITDGSSVSHVGIYTGEGRFIHSQSVGSFTGVMYSHMDEGNWRRNFVGVGRVLPWDEEVPCNLKEQSLFTGTEGCGSDPD